MFRRVFVPRNGFPAGNLTSTIPGEEIRGYHRRGTFRERPRSIQVPKDSASCRDIFLFKTLFLASSCPGRRRPGWASSDPLTHARQVQIRRGRLSTVVRSWHARAATAKEGLEQFEVKAGEP